MRVRSILSLPVLVWVLLLTPPAQAVDLIFGQGLVDRLTVFDPATPGSEGTNISLFGIRNGGRLTETVRDGRASATVTYDNEANELSIRFRLVRGGDTPADRSSARLRGKLQFRVSEPMRYELSGSMQVEDTGEGDNANLFLDLLNVTRGRLGLERLYNGTKRSESTPDERFTSGLVGGDVTDLQQGSLTGELLPILPGDPYPDRRYELTYDASLFDERSDPGDEGAVAVGEFVVKLTPFSPTFEPRVSALKRDELIDADGDGRAEPGEIIEYTVSVSNPGPVDAEGVLLSDTLDPNTRLLVGSVVTSAGTVLAGNLAGDTDVQVELGTLAVGEVADVRFQVQIDDPLAPEVQQVVNRALVTGDNFAVVQSDDPDSSAADDETRTPLANSSLDRCEREAEALESEVEQCLDDLASLRSDIDEDGVLDLVDRCPETLPGSEVDALGCSLAQFCQDVPGSVARWPGLACHWADWKNDEPLFARDCRWQGGECSARRGRRAGRPR